MEKKIEDYLHLYLGCDCQYVDGYVFRFCGLVQIFGELHVEGPKNGMSNNAYQLNKIKPILRQLSDMTSEEKIQCDVQATEATEYTELYPHITQWARRVDWLLKRHFDIFNLIKSGLAIDATTLKK